MQTGEEKKMGVVKEIIRNEKDGSISFGDYSLSEKAKVEDFSHAGDVYKCKTYNDITKLEKNGLFSYESVPGTAVINFKETENGVSFTVCGDKDAQITLGLMDETEYDVTVDGADAGVMKTGLGGKLTVGVELENRESVKVKVTKK